MPENITKKSRPALSFLLFVFSLLQFHKTDILILWKLTIVSTEFGQWIAPITLTLFLLSVGGARLSKIDAANSLLLFLATFLFLLPAFEMEINKKALAQSLEKTFGPMKTPAHAPVRPPSLFRLWDKLSSQKEPRPSETIIYKKTSDTSLALDAYLTATQTPATAVAARSKSPWVLVVHGGGWDAGDRRQLPELNPILVQHGIAVFSIDYRLAPQWHWPAPREDVADAVNFIKGRAEEFNIDPARWVILGRSAGGQIVETFAFQQNDPTLKGVISFYGPSDMEFAYKWGREDDILASRQVLREFLGGTPEQLPALYRDASALNFVTAEAPPVLQFHGPLDPLVWIMHSRRLDDKLKSLGRPTLLVEMPWATHGFDYTIYGAGGQTSTFAVLYFLERQFNP